MIIITYDPEQGHVVPDGCIAFYVTNIIRAHVTQLERSSQFVIARTVGSGTMVNEFRLRVARGELSYEHVQFVFNGQVLMLNQYAVPSEWPKGFADLDDQQVSEILICALKRRRNQKAKDQ